MTDDQNHSALPTSPPTQPSSEEIIRKLEQFPVEVLEAALFVLQMRQTKPKP